MNSAIRNGVIALCLKTSQSMPAVKFLVFMANFALVLHHQSFEKEMRETPDKNATDSQSYLMASSF